MADKAHETLAIEALIGGSVEVRDFADGHDENLTPKGARDVVNILKLADLKIVPQEEKTP